MRWRRRMIPRPGRTCGQVPAPGLSPKDKESRPGRRALFSPAPGLARPCPPARCDRLAVASSVLMALATWISQAPPAGCGGRYPRPPILLLRRPRLCCRPAINCARSPRRARQTRLAMVVLVFVPGWPVRLLFVQLRSRFATMETAASSSGCGTVR